MRVANSVVLFTNSSIARGIEYAINSGADVLSMSMGGVPAQVWVDIVNRAYDAGVVLVHRGRQQLRSWQAPDSKIHRVPCAVPSRIGGVRRHVW